jgi:hypothetical protein
MSGHSVATIDVLLVSSNEKQNNGKIQVISWSPPERTKRALKTWAICWGAAIVCVMFPIVHFVAVPGFLLAGPIAAFFIWAQEAKVMGGECTCPSCGNPFQVAKGRPQWPLSDVCSKCHEAITITPRQELRPNGTDPRP